MKFSAMLAAQVRHWMAPLVSTAPGLSPAESPAASPALSPAASMWHGMAVVCGTYCGGHVVCRVMACAAWPSHLAQRYHPFSASASHVSYLGILHCGDGVLCIVQAQPSALKPAQLPAPWRALPNVCRSLCSAICTMGMAVTMPCCHLLAVD